MRFKTKALVGFYQCIAAIPSISDVTMPPGLSDYIPYIHLLELRTTAQIRTNRLPVESLFCTLPVKVVFASR
jgi:hypothetical protein